MFIPDCVYVGSDYSRVSLWRVEDAVSSLIRRYEPYPTESLLYHRSTDSYRLTTGQEHFYHLVQVSLSVSQLPFMSMWVNALEYFAFQGIVFVKKDDNVLLYHVRDWPKLTGAPLDDEGNGADSGEGEVDNANGNADVPSTTDLDTGAVGSRTEVITATSETIAASVAN